MAATADGRTSSNLYKDKIFTEMEQAATQRHIPPSLCSNVEKSLSLGFLPVSYHPHARTPVETSAVHYIGNKMKGYLIRLLKFKK